MSPNKRTARLELRKLRSNPLAWETRKIVPSLSKLVQAGPEWADSNASNTIKRLDFAA